MTKPGNPDRFRNHFCSVTRECVHLRGNGCPLSAGIWVSLDTALLVVDELGFQALDRVDAHLLFKVVSGRYERGSIVLTSVSARVLTILVSLACLGAAALLWSRVQASGAQEEVAGWMRGVALLGIAIAAVAVVWQALPALLI